MRQRRRVCMAYGARILTVSSCTHTGGKLSHLMLAQDLQKALQSWKVSKFQHRPLQQYVSSDGVGGGGRNSGALATVSRLLHRFGDRDRARKCRRRSSRVAPLGRSSRKRSTSNTNLEALRRLRRRSLCQLGGPLRCQLDVPCRYRRRVPYMHQV